jgi:hypothetical protein
MPEIPEEMNLMWIAKFLGMAPREMYELNNAGLGPVTKKKKNQYIVTRKAFIIWLATRQTKGVN